MLAINKIKQFSSDGFTIAELAVAISITTVLSIAFVGILTNYYLLIARNNASIDMTVTSQNLLRSTVESLRYGDGIRQTNTITDANAPSGGWNTSNTNFVIVIATPAMDSSHNYIIDPLTGSPYMNELVYYKSGSSLMERTLANPSAANDTLVTSCPSSKATPSCPADKDLADYFSSMSFTMYDQDHDSTTDPTVARTIKISLTMQRTAFGAPLTLSNSIEVTLRNDF